MRHPVLAKLEGDDVVTCREGEPGCTKFEIGDLNALMATVYADAESRFVGARCDTAPKNILRDGNGRIDRTANGAGCKGLNPGSMLIVLGHRLKRDRTPMVIDAQTDSNTDQIWNQPAYRYKVHRFETLSETEATNYVRRGKRRAGLFGRNRNRDYKWNDAAKGFALVDVEVIWVTEQGPNTSFVSGLQSSKSTRMTSIIELDRDANDPAAEIIGGELLEDGTAETSRLINNPFVWLATGPGPESSTEHNPFVKTSVVRQLMALGRE